MNGKSIFLLALAGVLCTGWIYRPAAKEPKRVIGQTETVEIAEASIGLLGRVDTGAATTSVHAESVQVDGNMVRFDLVNLDGRRISMLRPIAKRGMVHNAERSEERVYVELTLQHAGLEKRVLVNLNDRSSLTYPLLLGRNWLKDDFVVDVAREAVKPSADPESGPRESPQLAAS